MVHVQTDELKEALEYLNIQVPESLQKGLDTKPLEGSEQNGGGSEENDLSKKKEELSGKIAKAKEDLQKLEKEHEDLEKGCPVSGLEKPEVTEKKEESMEKSNSQIEVLEKGMGHLGTIIKSQMETLQNLSSKMEEFFETPQERRSASNISELRKSMGFESLDNKGEDGSQKVSRLEKGRVSNILMDLYVESGSNDQSLEKSVMTYEASGYLDPSTVALVKSKRNIEII